MATRTFTAALGVTAAATGLLTGAAPAHAQQQAPSLRAARSTTVTVNNNTGCDFRFDSRGGDTGIFLTPGGQPSLDTGGTGKIETESDGIFSGLDKWQSWTAEDCSRGNLNGRSLRLHWVNPYIGSNHCDAQGTDAYFDVDWECGRGNNSEAGATVTES
jgi:hypothetical protein